MAIVEPKTRRFLIICATVVFVAVAVFFTVTVSKGMLDGNDVVKIIEAISGIFKEAPTLKQ